MKSIAAALAAGVLVVAANSVAADAFPQGSEDYMFGLAQGTYADSHPVTVTGSASPEVQAGRLGRPAAQSTYADRRAGDLVGTGADDDAFFGGSISHPE